jgi:hypothetical protein
MAPHEQRIYRHRHDGHDWVFVIEYLLDNDGHVVTAFIDHCALDLLDVPPSTATHQLDEFLPTWREDMPPG